MWRRAGARAVPCTRLDAPYAGLAQHGPSRRIRPVRYNCAVSETRSISFNRSPAAVLGAVVVLLFAVGGVIQTAVLARTVRDGLGQTSNDDARAFLGHANRVIPDGAAFASDVPAAAYGLYPRHRAPVRLTGPASRVQSAVRRDQVRYLVVRLPLPAALAAASWTRVIYRDEYGAVLETTSATG